MLEVDSSITCRIHRQHTLFDSLTRELKIRLVPGKCFCKFSRYTISERLKLLGHHDVKVYTAQYRLSKAIQQKCCYISKWSHNKIASEIPFNTRSLSWGLAREILLLCSCVFRQNGHFRNIKRKGLIPSKYMTSL